MSVPGVPRLVTKYPPGFLELALAGALLVLTALFAIGTFMSSQVFLVGAFGCFAAGWAGRFLRLSVVGVFLAMLGYLMVAPEAVGAAEYACMIPVASAMAQGRRVVALVASVLFVGQEAVLHAVRFGLYPWGIVMMAFLWAFFLGVSAAVGATVHGARQLEQLRQAEVYRIRQRGLASDLHDTAAHQLARMALWADQAANDGGASPEDLKRHAVLVRQAAGDLRRVMELLEVDAPEDQIEQAKPLGEVLELSERRLREAGYAVATTIEGDPDTLTDRLAIPLGKILTEVVNNIERHGDPERPAVIVLEIGAGAVELLVSNGRSGSGPALEGRGLAGVRERAALIDGEVEVLARGHQWTVHVAVPLERESA